MRRPNYDVGMDSDSLLTLTPLTPREWRRRQLRCVQTVLREVGEDRQVLRMLLEPVKP